MAANVRCGLWVTAYICCAELLQSCPTLCDPMDCSLPGSSVHRVLQARILEWVPIPSSRGSSQPVIKPSFPTEPRFPTQEKQTGVLPSEPPEKPKNTGVGSLFLLQGFFPTQELGSSALQVDFY